LVVTWATGCNQDTDSATRRGGSGDDVEAESNAVEPPVPDPQPFVIKVVPNDENPRHVVVTVIATEGFGRSKEKLKAAGSTLLSMHLIFEGDPSPFGTEISDLTPLLGRYTVEAESLSFWPTFRLSRGARYAIRFNARKLSSDPLARVMWKEYQTQLVIDAPAPKIETITPTAEVLPANHLKFYLRFTEPMQTGDIWQYFHLQNVTKKEPVPRPFRHTELWSEDRRTLTLWFHPGRQKIGVNLNVEVGPILLEGNEYQLVISGDWKSARSVSLSRDVTKTFRAGPPDHEQLFVAKWRITAPKPATRHALTIDLGESLDAALLQTEIVIENPTGQPVSGTISLEKQESVWTFRPDEPWQPGRYQLAVGSVLEDLSGNSIERPFEVDLQGEPLKPVGSTVRRTFPIGVESK